MRAWRSITSGGVNVLLHYVSVDRASGAVLASPGNGGMHSRIGDVDAGVRSAFERTTAGLRSVMVAMVNGERGVCVGVCGAM